MSGIDDPAQDPNRPRPLISSQMGRGPVYLLDAAQIAAAHYPGDTNNTDTGTDVYADTSEDD